MIILSSLYPIRLGLNKRSRANTTDNCMYLHSELACIVSLCDDVAEL